MKHMKPIIYSAITGNLKKNLKNKDNFLIMRMGHSESNIMIQKGHSYISPFYVLGFENLNTCIIYNVNVL